jgi:ornithine cyclodeaminase
MKIRILDAAAVRDSLPMNLAIEAMKNAYAQLTACEAEVPLRSRLPVRGRQGVTLVMPALLEKSGDMAVKVVSVFPGNEELGLPSIHAIVVAVDPDTGQPQAILDGGSLTAIRTGAGSGAATDLLARQNAHRMAIFGSGVQARTQVEAVCCVRPIDQITIFGIESDSVQTFACELRSQLPSAMRISVADSPSDAVQMADIVCTATTSHTPVFPGSAIQPGTHINAIGSFTPEMQEIDEVTVTKALVFVDSSQAVLEEAGDLIIPMSTGALNQADLGGEVGDIVLERKKGRTDPDQITLFKSVGVAVQDAAAASLALSRALEFDRGQIVEL